MDRKLLAVSYEADVIKSLCDDIITLCKDAEMLCYGDIEEVLYKLEHAKKLLYSATNILEEMNL